MVSGFFDFFRWAWHWWSVPGPARHVTLCGSVGTSQPLRGSTPPPRTLAGSAGTSQTLRGEES